MGEEATPTATVHRSSVPSAAASSSPALRFLGVLKQPNDPDPDPALELDESDVVWSFAASPAASDLSLSDSSPALAAAANGEHTHSPAYSSSPASSSSPSAHLRRPGRPFLPEKFGLSAALADDEPSVRRSAGLTARPVEIPGRRTPVEERGRRGLHHQSAPVAVPVWRNIKEMRRGASEALGEVEDEEEEEGKMVPPHLIAARSQMAAFSVLEGAGRTLKGRDLRRMRNAVWRQTGFLDL